MVSVPDRKESYERSLGVLGREFQKFGSREARVGIQGGKGRVGRQEKAAIGKTYEWARLARAPGRVCLLELPAVLFAFEQRPTAVVTRWDA